MAQPVIGGPARLTLMASVARRYYADGKSKIQIADEFRISRFQVARLIEAARTSGMVRIEIGYPGAIDVVLSGELRDALGLKHAVVVDTVEESGPALRTAVGEAAAELLTEILVSTDILGLGWARSVSAMAAALTRLPSVPVVQLTGALTMSAMENSSIDLVREIARLTGGPAHLFYAPMTVRDAATARALRQQPEVARAFDHLPAVTKAVVGLGSWAAGSSTLYDAIEEPERREAAQAGVCADISGVLIDAEGRPIVTTLSERILGVDAAQLAAIPEVIAIPYGIGKAPAVRAAVRSGIVNGIVTHTSLAKLLLDGR